MRKIIGLILICVMGYGWCYAIDRLQIEAEVRRQVQDVSETRWTDAQLYSIIEMAHIDVVRKSRCLQGTTVYTTYQSTREYTLPSDLLLVERVGFKILNSTSAYEKMERMTLFGLDADRTQWQTEGNGKPLEYYIWGNQLGLVPPCSNTYAGNYLKIWYVVSPSSMTTDSSTPFNDYKFLYPYHELIIWRAAMICKTEERLFGEAAALENRYYYLLTIMIKELNSKPDYFPDFKM
jgi:hypothetical protein